MHLQRMLTTVVAAVVLIASATPTRHRLSGSDHANTTAHRTRLRQRGVSFDWGTAKVRGVSLGGWLLLEPFITPSFFLQNSDSDEIHDEWTLCAKLGKPACYSLLKPHWETFVSESDFWKIKNAGLNVVRIPIGYWSLWDDAGAPYTTGALPYLDRAISWARKTGLKVIIDLHSAPRSQNGFDHSGHRMNGPEWGQHDSIGKTHYVLWLLESQYAVPSLNDVVIGIELLNEPFMELLDEETVKQFYRDGYYNLRLINEDMPVILQDGFWNPEWLNSFLTPSDNGAKNVIVDHHEYQIFGSGSGAMEMSVDQHVNQVCAAAQSYVHSSDKWLIVGEWSAAMTDCAPHLNGFRSGNRYEGTYWKSWRVGSCQGKTGSVKEWNGQWKNDVRRYIETQLDVFERDTQGWVFWNFKTENKGAGEWDLFQLLDEGVFPNPVWDRKFGKAC
ncbi:glycoside hydrolase [Delitschia confertaspora ATCC 74209]|uniref:Glycoside hydrolase n=1 Tax=Delitschia confertaspora ATCC 74209 TaxID=1513339 RepID=A0A9P4MXU8_9PLEO|nr:glycoside hydrolase [Delitschia confertaspora ATCC 74209]